MTKLLLVASLLVIAVPAYAAGGKTTVSNERRAGTTSNAGNRCPGGSFDSCFAANRHVGWSARQATTQCARTCK